MNFRMAQRILGLMLMIFSLTMLPPIGVSFLYADGHWEPFLAAAAIIAGAGFLLWLPARNTRRDLRLRDNPALAAAARGGESVVPLFVFDDRLLRGRCGAPNRLAFLLESLWDLDRSLRERGAALLVRRGDPVKEAVRIAVECGAEAIFFSDDASGYARRRRERLEAACAEQQHLGVEHLQLAVDADLGQQRVARVAVALLGGHAAGRDDRQPLLLPGEDAARHRGDVGVAERFELGGGGVGAVAAAAVEDRAGRLVRRGGGDLIREQSGRHQLAVLEVGLLELVRLARVDQDDVAARDLLLRLERLDLLDLSPHLRLRTVRH